MGHSKRLTKPERDALLRLLGYDAFEEQGARSRVTIALVGRCLIYRTRVCYTPTASGGLAERNTYRLTARGRNAARQVRTARLST